MTYSIVEWMKKVFVEQPRLDRVCYRGQISPAMLHNPEMDTFCPTEPVCPRMDTLIMFWPSNEAKLSFFGES